MADAIYRSARRQETVRFSECDPAGIVYNGNFLMYVELAMSDIWDEVCGGYLALQELGYLIPVVSTELNFHRPMRPGTDFVTSAQIIRLGNSSMKTKVAVESEEGLVLDGILNHVLVDAKTLKSTPIPDHLRERLQQPSTSPSAA